MGRRNVLLVIWLCYCLLFVAKMQCTRELSMEKELDREIHLKILNKSSTRSAKIILNPLDHNSNGREILEVDNTKVANPANTYLAVARTKAGPGKYSGGACIIKLDNPRVAGQKFSATRIRLQGGGDSIEAGWRVDLSLYGDSKTRLFIRTDAGKTHCFDIRCPGFIQLYLGMELGSAFDNISIPGSIIYNMKFNIMRNSKNGNWNFFMGDNSTLIGYWPPHIFTGLNALADRVEWGGAAHSPPGTPLPPMGSGNHPIEASAWDGYISQMKVVNEKGQAFDAPNVEIYEDNSKFYSVLDIGYFGRVWGYVILYGGPGH